MEFSQGVTPRVLRHQIEHKKLSDITRHVAAICPSIDSCEAEVRLSDWAVKCGFTNYDVVGVRLWTQGLGILAILVPLRLWHKPLWFRRAIELRDFVRRSGQKCIIVPASVVMKQPRLTNARLIASCVGYAVKVSDQLKVLDRIVEQGGLSLYEAASFVDAKDPAAAVLSMVSRRQIAIDVGKPIGPHSALMAVT